ncbi:MAG: four helix bundle protein [Candidatus Marinimicrobia bacterium]|nr:four helix bundle protein [Candidatus Neomarinimicrobiota bacterium]
MYFFRDTLRRSFHYKYLTRVMIFNHEKLVVYSRSVALNAKVAGWLSLWDARHAVCGQFHRAAQSISENIAVSSASQARMKSRYLDYALGSTLECAACLDLASIKDLLDQGVVRQEKGELAQIFRMLFGLHRAWSPERLLVKEPDMDYKYGESPLFAHEQLDIYQAALDTARLMASSEAIDALPPTHFRPLDELVTSVLLNIAEGNGRFSKAEQRRFLGTTHVCAIKLAAKLDLTHACGSLIADDIAGIKHCLQRVTAMCIALIRE